MLTRSECHKRVGAWVRVDATGREGLIVRWIAVAGWFVVEFEDGAQTSETPENLTVIAE
jgi:hypothetical protein